MRPVIGVLVLLLFLAKANPTTFGLCIYKSCIPVFNQLGIKKSKQTALGLSVLWTSCLSLLLKQNRKTTTYFALGIVST